MRVLQLFNLPVRAGIFAAAAAAVICLAGGALGGEPGPDEAAWAACRKQVAEHKFGSDYDAARSALRRFLAAWPDSPRAAEARKELEAVGGFADRQIQGLYDGARSLSDKLRYELALELYTEILTRAPNEDWVRKAREGIERNDKATEPLFHGLEKKCRQLFSEWKFSAATGLAESTVEQLAGTRWADPAKRLLEEARVVRDYFARLARTVEENKEDRKKTPFKVKDLTGWMVRGEIAKISETGFLCMVTGAGRDFGWKDRFGADGRDPSEFLKIVDLYEPAPRDNMALGVLLYRLGIKSAAVQRFRLAATDQDFAEKANHYADLITGNLNRLAYDFSSGLQLLDWRASGGRWRIKGGELVQEGASGEGEIELVKEKYRSKEVRFFYEMSVKSDRGLVSVVFRQDERNSFGFAFSPAEGYSAFASLEGKVKTVKDAKYRLPQGRKLRVRCGLKGDTFALSVGKTKLPRLVCPGLSRLEGHFLLRTLDSRARFDNLVIRNKKD
jgi:hypothetical protein